MLAVTGGKGGTGTTVSTLGLAVALGADALAVDGDWTLPNLHALAGVGRGWGADTTPPERDAPRRASPRHLRCTRAAAPSVLSAPPVPADRDREAVLRRLATRKAPTVVDTPSGVGPQAVGPLRVADGTIIVTTQCAPALRGAQKTAAIADAVETPVVAVVVTRTARVPAAVSRQFDAPARAVPAADPPVLTDERVMAGYGRVATVVRETARPEWSEESTHEHGATDERADENPADTGM